MEEFKKYMEDFKSKSIDEKKAISLEQLKLIVSLTNTMCKEVGSKNELIITEDLADVEKSSFTEEDFVEAVVVYSSSIQNSLCDFIDKFSEIIEKLEKL